MGNHNYCNKCDSCVHCVSYCHDLIEGVCYRCRQNIAIKEAFELIGQLSKNLTSQGQVYREYLKKHEDIVRNTW